MFGIGMSELLIILIICLVIFGAGKLPEIGRSLGKALQEFKNAGKEKPEETNTESKTEKKE